MSRGVCECGCGQATTVADKGSRRDSRVKGQPMRFVSGHNNLKSLVPYTVDLDSECWIWLRATSANGYGRMAHNGVNTAAHRVYYERKHGPIPKGLDLDHLCRNRGCVNPDHLEPVTRAENLRRGANGKLTREAVDEIRQLAAATSLTQVQIGAQFGITGQHAGRVIRGLSGR